MNDGLGPFVTVVLSPIADIGANIALRREVSTHNPSWPFRSVAWLM